MKKYYFTSEIRGIVGEHSGNIRGAKTKAQKFAEQFDEEITILVRSNKEIDCGKNIPANEEVCRVCNADGDVLAVCSTYGNAFAWCAENGIEGEIGEYEPYIEVGTYSENGNFEVEDYSSINTGDGMWNIINDYCYYFDKVCPEATAETVEETAEQEETEAKKAVDEDIEYAEKKYAEMEAEQTQADEAAETEPAKTPNKYQKEVITMKATKYTNKELVEIYKNLKTSAKILGFASASDCEMMVAIELEAVKRHLNLIDGTVEETAERQTAEQETVEGISKMETTTETDDSGFEYTTSQAQEIIMTGTSIAKAEEKKTQFDFYNVTIGFEVEKFIGTIPADYESLGIYSDYEKAVQAAQAAADEYGAENIYFHTVEIATRNDREVYDRDDYEDFIEERETIRHNWYTLTIVDTGKREHVNLDKPVRLDFEE
ncbi:MAG: hypothetical protein II453_17740 [Alphaproteobacteria bacterium]|nr:hypothetical protein [Alphaproteobacteria bacterium]